MPSHPAWVCGLKQKDIYWLFAVEYVTPCVGVWIETTFRKLKNPPPLVTPCVGVWIETSDFQKLFEQAGVTPCVGVWIET